MKYTIDDINFDDLSFTEFENLCYDLIIKYNYHNVIWRKGGPDNGRDIEGYFTLNNNIIDKETKWFFECKHYKTGGVPPAELNSKIAWADSEQPNFLVLFISSYLTTSSRTWLKGIEDQKSYDIIIIEQEQLKERILIYPDLIERYFSLEKYMKLYIDIKNYQLKFNISPSYEFLIEIMQNIDLEKLEANDFGFLLLNFYEQYNLFESRDNTYGDFNPKITERLFNHLETNCSTDSLTSFIPYKDSYMELGGNGFFDEIDWIDEVDKEIPMHHYNFQKYILHLNHNKDKESWRIGEYLFYIHNDSAFEIFLSENTEIRLIKDFSFDKICDISINVATKKANRVEEYFNKFSN